MKLVSQLEKSQDARAVKKEKTVQEAAPNEYIRIKDLKVGKTYHQVFLVESAQRKGKSKVVEAMLRDISGSIFAKIWEWPTYIDPSPVLNYVYIEAVANVRKYYGKTEVNINFNDIKFTNCVPINIHDYESTTNTTDLEDAASEILNFIASIKDEHYRNIIGNAIESRGLMNALMTSPYGVSGPLSFPGGLLIHTAKTLRFIKTASDYIDKSESKINKSLLIIGTILRNIGWSTISSNTSNGIKFNDSFNLVGVERASFRYINHLLITVESDLEIQIPEVKKQALENVALSGSDIKTVEGQMIEAANRLTDIMLIGSSELQKKQNGNWINELFVGHITK